MTKEPTVISAGKPRAAVVLVHGMAEHKERYYPFMTYLSEMGFACVITDLRGHGADAAAADELGYFGKRGKEALISDTLEVVEWTRERFPGLKVFLFGHSMGSMIVRCFTKKYDGKIDGLVVCGSPSANPLSGPGIFITRCIRLVKGDRYRSRFVARMMFGSAEKKSAAPGEGLRNSWLSTNKANVQAYNNDPLCGFRFTLNGYRVVMQLLRYTYSVKGWTVGNPSLPIHFIVGGNDPLIGSLEKFSRAVSFIRRRGYKEVTAKVYPGMKHEILNEIGKEEVWRDIEALLKLWM